MHLARLLHHRQRAPLGQRAPMASTMLPLAPLVLLVERALVPTRVVLVQVRERVSTRVLPVLIEIKESSSGRRVATPCTLPGGWA